MQVTKIDMVHRTNQFRIWFHSLAQSKIRYSVTHYCGCLYLLDEIATRPAKSFREKSLAVIVLQNFWMEMLYTNNLSQLITLSLNVQRIAK